MDRHLHGTLEELPEFYQQHFRTLLTVLLTRLQSSKSPKYRRDFVVSCSLFVHRQPNGIFAAAMTEIQTGLLANLLGSIWPPVMKMALRLDERKVCTLAMSRLMAHDEIRQNPQLLNSCCVSLISLLGLTPSTTVPIGEEGSDDEVPPVNGGAGLDFEVSFNKLRNTDLPGASAGLAPDVPDLPAAAKALLKPQLPAVGQLTQANAELQPLVVFLQ